MHLISDIHPALWITHFRSVAIFLNKRMLYYLFRVTLFFKLLILFFVLDETFFIVSLFFTFFVVLAILLEALAIRSLLLLENSLL